MELYTSLVRLKQAMNGGQMPPMTPVPESALGLIDPEFTIGLGGLTEDAEKGLRCPVRGCGGYFHRLDMHVKLKHKDCGGVTAVTRALEIPDSAGLVSRVYAERRGAVGRAALAAYRQRLAASGAAHPGSATLRAIPLERRREYGKAGARASTRSFKSTGYRNLQDRCTAQLSHRIIDLHHSLGRTPACTEFISRYGESMYRGVLDVFGTWRSALAQCGLEALGHGRARNTEVRDADRRELVLAALAAWYSEHGSLPATTDADGKRSPLLPSRDIVMLGLGMNRRRDGGTWREAMRRAASILNIYGGRYGLPLKQSAA